MTAWAVVSAFGLAVLLWLYLADELDDRPW